MKAPELWDLLYKGEQHEPTCQVVGSKPNDVDIEMICDCSPGDEC